MNTERTPADSVVRIVELPGRLELRSRAGQILCTMVCGRDAGALQQRARVYLISEARSYGYARIEEVRDDAPDL
jgi:hypothetical protein